MKNSNYVEYFNLIKGFSNEEYLAAKLLYIIAPVIYGRKPSSIVTFASKSDSTYELWECLGEKFLSKINLECCELRKNEKNITVMFYSRSLLKVVLAESCNLQFLHENGYQGCSTLDEFLKCLKGRFLKSCPHEMGIFLGIPVEDVRSFVKNCGENSIFCGYWKVYNDLEYALRTFERYNFSKWQVIDLVMKGEKPTNILFKLQ